jgi:hypothetical protein
VFIVKTLLRLRSPTPAGPKTDTGCPPLVINGNAGSRRDFEEMKSPASSDHERSDPVECSANLDIDDGAGTASQPDLFKDVEAPASDGNGLLNPVSCSQNLHSENDKDILDFTSTSFQQFSARFENLAKQNGTMIGREAKKMSETLFEQTFPGRKFDYFISRGMFYCIVNKKHGITCIKTDPNAITNRKSECERTVRFRYDRDDKLYRVIRDTTNTSHSHSVHRDAICASSWRQINHDKKMTQHEIDFALELGSAMV